MSEPRRATITISETPKENTLSIDVEFFPELNLQDDAFSGDVYKRQPQRIPWAGAP